MCGLRGAATAGGAWLLSAPSAKMYRLSSVQKNSCVSYARVRTGGLPGIQARSTPCLRRVPGGSLARIPAMASLARKNGAATRQRRLARLGIYRLGGECARCGRRFARSGRKAAAPSRPMCGWLGLAAPSAAAGAPLFSPQRSPRLGFRRCVCLWPGGQSWAFVLRSARRIGSSRGLSCWDSSEGTVLTTPLLAIRLMSPKILSARALCPRAAGRRCRIWIYHVLFAERIAFRTHRRQVRCFRGEPMGTSPWRHDATRAGGMLLSDELLGVSGG